MYIMPFVVHRSKGQQVVDMCLLMHQVQLYTIAVFVGLLVGSLFVVGAVVDKQKLNHVGVVVVVVDHLLLNMDHSDMMHKYHNH